MTDQELADEIIKRLNKLCEDPDVRADIGRLIETRIPVSRAAAEHPDIQMYDGKLGFLGLLNGLIGVRPHNGMGYIAARFNEEAMGFNGFQLARML